MRATAKISAWDYAIFDRLHSIQSVLIWNGFIFFLLLYSVWWMRVATVPELVWLSLVELKWKHVESEGTKISKNAEKERESLTLQRNFNKIHVMCSQRVQKRRLAPQYVCIYPWDCINVDANPMFEKPFVGKIFRLKNREANVHCDAWVRYFLSFTLSLSCAVQHIIKKHAYYQRACLLTMIMRFWGSVVSLHFCEHFTRK